MNQNKPAIIIHQRMRKTINVLAMLFAFFSMAGCSESEPEVVPEAFLSADRLIFDQAASEKPVTVTLVGELAVSSVESSAEDWCTAEMSADAIVVKVTANDTEEYRSADVVVKFDSEVVLPMTIKVAQESGEVPYLKTTASESFEFGCRGGEYKFSVSSSAQWKAELVDCSWATLSSDASSVTVKAPANDGNEVLSGKVKVTSGETSLEYAFTQATLASDKYLALLGEYDIYAEKWYQVTRYASNKGWCSALGKGGTLRELCTSPASSLFTTTATLTEDKYGVSYYLEGCFLQGQKLPIVLNKKTGGLEIPALWNTGTALIYYNKYSPPEDMSCFLVDYTVSSDNSMKYNQYAAGVIKASVSEDCNTITIDTSKEQKDGEVEGSGLTLVYMNMGLSSPVLTPFEGIYMPYGNTVELRRKTDE